MQRINGWSVYLYFGACGIGRDTGLFPAWRLGFLEIAWARGYMPRTTREWHEALKNARRTIRSLQRRAVVQVRT